MGILITIPNMNQEVKELTSQYVLVGNTYHYLITDDNKDKVKKDEC